MSLLNTEQDSPIDENSYAFSLSLLLCISIYIFFALDCSHSTSLVHKSTYFTYFLLTYFKLELKVAGDDSEL